MGTSRFLFSMNWATPFAPTHDSIMVSGNTYRCSTPLSLYLSSVAFRLYAKFTYSRASGTGFSAAVDKLGTSAIACEIYKPAREWAKIRALIPQTAMVYAWSQNDSAAAQWLKDVNKRTSARVRCVIIPREHKDLNDWTKAGATKCDLESAISSSPALAKPATPDLSILLEKTVVRSTQSITFSSVHQAVLIALWIAHTYLIELFACTPYLHITSPAKRCGKSNLLTLSVPSRESL